MTKKVLIFDQDDTINAGSKQPIDAEVGRLFVELLGKYDIAVVTGTGWDIVKKVDVDALKGATSEKLTHYHILPTQGTQYWRFDSSKEDWVRQYANFFTDEQAKKVSELLEGATRKLGYWVDLPDGDEIVENRGSQITYSALGQWAEVAAKKAWDPDLVKRQEIVAEVKSELDDMGLNVTIGGSTSIDVTMPGIDKAYAVRKLMEANGFKPEECLFVGDMLEEGGNDYPVKAAGIDTIAVKDCNDTAYILRGILAVS